MPIYEFYCNKCKKKIELLIMSGDKLVCKDCGGNDLERLFSTFASPGSGGPSSGHSCASCGPGHNCSTCK